VPASARNIQLQRVGSRGILVDVAARAEAEQKPEKPRHIKEFARWTEGVWDADGGRIPGFEMVP